MAATVAAVWVVRNSARLTAVEYVELGDGTLLPLMLSDLLAAGAGSGLPARLRKLGGVQVSAECAEQQLQALRQRTGLTHLDINGTALQNRSAEESRQALMKLKAALQGMRSLTCLHLRWWILQSEVAVTTLAPVLWPLTQLSIYTSYTAG